MNFLSLFSAQFNFLDICHFSYSGKKKKSFVDSRHEYIF